MDKEKFLSSEQMSQFLKYEDLPAQHVQFTETVSPENSTTLYSCRLKKTEFLSAEFAWFAISSALNDDPCEMCYRDFELMPYQEYYAEVTMWAIFCNFDMDKFFPGPEKPLSILRLAKELDRSEFLLDYENEYAYILIEMNHP
ncbi:hypothetical protein [Desertivirga brevis]|uniref:hypothetical protein n=1 Tax=Desertivirga brevis TaxID=2810310 RepID=UPI001A96EE87|nr:hypothetical protein [Pedobacter sp. SYSU D00873]